MLVYMDTEVVDTLNLVLRYIEIVSICTVPAQKCQLDVLYISTV